MSERGEILTLMLLAFVIFTMCMAMGIAVDRATAPDPPASPGHKMPPVEDLDRIVKQ